MTTLTAAPKQSSNWHSLVYKLNTDWHERALQVFLVITILHWVEHFTQAVQIFLLQWPRPEAGGVLGLFFPWLVRSEWLHYAYAIVMLVFLFALRPGFSGRGRLWWNIALGIQFWHHFEHALLLVQVLGHFTLFGSPTPVSVLQLFVKRAELHIYYNAAVFVPMVAAMFYHMYPPADEAGPFRCTCVRHSVPALAETATT